MQVIDTIEDLRKARKAISGRVGGVLTMGALHEGHLSLVQHARTDNDAVITTIFVNPTQFAPTEDFSGYPRDLAHDLSMLEKSGVDVVFTPKAADMYPSNFQTFVKVDHVTQGLEGDHRPGHFRGVVTIVSKLFNLTQPTIAYFGQKDAQQVVVIRRMVKDLNFPLDIAVIPTVREPDGLAMSSRNTYLTPEERKAGGVIYRSLVAAAQAYDEGERTPANLRAVAKSVLKTEASVEIEYVAINDPQSLLGVHEPSEEPILLSMVVQLGKPRLLDNCLLPWSLNTREGLTATLGA